MTLLPFLLLTNNSLLQNIQDQSTVLEAVIRVFSSIAWYKPSIPMEFSFEVNVVQVMISGLAEP